METFEAVPRETLYDQVWTDPMVKVAAKYGVSSSYMARVCERLNVPRPARGYWAQLEVGKAPVKPPLPDARVGDELEWSRDGDQTHSHHPAPRPPASREERAAARPTTFRQPKQHPLLVGAKDHFDRVRDEKNGYLRPTKRKLVDVFVSRPTLDRALAFTNRLFRALEARGYRVTFPPGDVHFGRPAIDERSKGGRDREGYGLWSPDRPTVVYVGTVAIGLTLVELSEQREVQYVDGKYVPVREVPIEKRHGFSRSYTWTTTHDLPSGRLCLRASSPYGVAKWEKYWREEKKGQLGSQIDEIVTTLEAAAATLATLVEEGARRAEEQRREWALQMERWKREEAERRLAQHTEEARDDLTSIIAAWASAKSVEAFFADAEQRAELLDQSERVSLVERIQRARELLGGVDALQRLRAWRAPDER